MLRSKKNAVGYSGNMMKISWYNRNSFITQKHYFSSGATNGKGCSSGLIRGLI